MVVIVASVSSSASVVAIEATLVASVENLGSKGFGSDDICSNDISSGYYYGEIPHILYMFSALFLINLLSSYPL